MTAHVHNAHYTKMILLTYFSTLLNRFPPSQKNTQINDRTNGQNVYYNLIYLLLLFFNIPSLDKHELFRNYDFMFVGLELFLKK